MADSDDVDLYRDFVAVSIEKALSEIGSPVANEVSIRLKETYGCDFSDCLTHPEYLTKVIKDLFGRPYLKIVKSINDQLEELTSEKPIGKFLKVITK